MGRFSMNRRTFTQKFFTNLSKILVLDPRSGIWKKTYSGSRIRVQGSKRHRIPGSGPATLQESLGPLKISLEMARTVIFPQKYNLPHFQNSYTSKNEKKKKFLCCRRASTERTGAAYCCWVCRAPDQHAAHPHQVGERPLRHSWSQGRRPCPGRHQGGNINDILVWIRIQILLFSSVSRPSKYFCLLLLFEGTFTSFFKR